MKKIKTQFTTKMKMTFYTFKKYVHTFNLKTQKLKKFCKFQWGRK